MAWPFKKKQPAEPDERSAYFSSETPLVSYWSYFKEPGAAEQAAQRLRAQALSADVEAPWGERKDWLLLAYFPLPPAEEIVELNRRIVKGVVSSLGGEYDGWEAGPLPDKETMDKIQDWLASGVGA